MVDFGFFRQLKEGTVSKSTLKDWKKCTLQNLIEQIDWSLPRLGTDEAANNVD